MTRRMASWVGVLVVAALAWSPPAHAADPKTAPPAAATAEQRQKMADIHQKMAECLRSDRPIAECRSEMAGSCHDSLGADMCPMMGKGGGMMHGGAGHGHLKQAPPPSTTP